MSRAASNIQPEQPSRSIPAAVEEQVETVAERYLEALRAGEEADHERLIAAHPELSPWLEPRLRLMARLHRAVITRGAEASAAGSIAPQTIGKFRVEGTLGEGAFGVVYRAEDTELERTVALKVPRAEHFHDEEKERFLREARNAARLNHTGIVKVHDVLTHDGRPCIVSECVDGKSLAELLETSRPDPSWTAEIVARVASALDHAHQHGVVHRDLKPANVLLEKGDQPRITDFGLARDMSRESTLTLEGQLLGTPAYMSPEQAAGDVERIDARSDVYSLGVILYEMLTGRRPFTGTTSAVLKQVLHDEPPAPRQIDADVPRGLESICLMAMAKDPSRRYDSAARLEEDLRRFQRGEIPGASPRRPGRRRQALVALVAGSVAVVLVAWLAVRALSPAATKPLASNNGTAGPAARMPPRFEVLLRRGSPLDLAQARTLRAGDELRLRFDAPRGLRPALFWFDSEGILSELDFEVAEAESGQEIVYPGFNDVVELRGPPGTELVFVCAGANRPSRADVEAAFAARTPLAMLPPGSILHFGPGAVTLVPSRRGPGEIRELEVHDLDGARKLHAALAAHFEWVGGVGFPHGE